MKNSTKNFIYISLIIFYSPFITSMEEESKFNSVFSNANMSSLTQEEIEQLKNFEKNLSLQMLNNMSDNEINAFRMLMGKLKIELLQSNQSPMDIQQAENKCIISMNQSHSIILDTNAKTEKTIAITALNGCIVTALHAHFTNGLQYAGMTHYAPVAETEHYTQIQKLCLQALQLQEKNESIKSINFFIVIPDKSILTHFNKDIVSWLEETKNKAVNDMIGIVNTTLQNIKSKKIKKLNYHRDELNYPDGDVKVVLHPQNPYLWLAQKNLKVPVFK